jgi:hypothetical protein
MRQHQPKGGKGGERESKNNSHHVINHHNILQETIVAVDAHVEFASIHTKLLGSPERP